MGLIDLSGGWKAWEEIEKAGRVRSCRAPALDEPTEMKASNETDFRAFET
jgi:hypothetical protein